MAELLPVHEHVRDLRNGAGPIVRTHVDTPGSAGLSKH
jgi:hypothetical protein